MENLGLFVNTLTADDKYSLLNRDTLRQPIQILVPEKKKFSSQFFSEYLKSTKKIVTLIADVFPKLPTPKKMIR